MITTFDLLARGYFPKELPPPFNTLDFANRVLGHIGPMPSFFARSKRSLLCAHNYARTVPYRRTLGIPNPIPQHALAVVIANHWERLQKLIQRSSLSSSVPVAAKGRALVPGDSPLYETKARLRATARHVVLADISRFYHSIYTHTIPWAIHGKRIAKAKRGKEKRRYLGNVLDELICNCQDGQTIGIPVGPDSSLVLAELVTSAVDQFLQKSIRGIRGTRFIDDYEFPCRTRRDANAILQRLEIALSKYELAINPLKTSILDLPVPIDQIWKTPIRTARVRTTPKEQSTDLVALFDIAYSLARQYQDKNVLAYTMGRIADVNICTENSELFQRLTLQCILAEPGTTPVVLERLAANHKDGLAVNAEELGELLNDQIIEHAPLNHMSEVAWAIWGSLIFDIKISKRAAKAASGAADSVVALTALHAQQRGLIDGTLSTDLWRSYLAPDQLYGEQWLLCYEASVKNWLKPPSGTDHIGADASFAWLRDIGVEFYDIDKAASIGVPGSGGTSWLDDLEELMQSRSSFYDEPDEEVDDEQREEDGGSVDPSIENLL